MDSELLLLLVDLQLVTEHQRLVHVRHDLWQKLLGEDRDALVVPLFLFFAQTSRRDLKNWMVVVALPLPDRPAEVARQPCLWREVIVCVRLECATVIRKNSWQRLEKEEL